MTHLGALESLLQVASLLRPVWAAGALLVRYSRLRAAQVPEPGQVPAEKMEEPIPLPEQVQAVLGSAEVLPGVQALQKQLV